MITAIALALAATAPATPLAAVESLLTEERSLSDAAATLQPADGIAAMLADDGVLMARQGPIRGRAAATANLRDNPANKGTHASWRPIRGGVSADGRHGFTMGYLDIAGGDDATAHRRYLAYWVRGRDGWRVATLKPAGETLLPVQPPALPTRIVAPSPGRTAAHQRTLIAAEKAFSDRAQQVGIRQSFQEYGWPDAIHMFGPTGFTIGLAAIGANHAAQEGDSKVSPVNWSADDAIVALSGDLGINIGKIRSNGPPPEGQPAEVPFVTIWRRDNPGDPWRYIAE